MNILAISSSGRKDDSVSRQLASELIAALRAKAPAAQLVERDLSQGVPFVDEAWIDANFTDPADRSDAQRAALAASDALVDELRAADVLVIASPVYNFGIPAALKAWVDMVLRARETFRYSATGPEGLLQNKKAYLVLASGGVAVDSAADFATPYLRHVLGFIGITDVEVVAAEKLGVDADAAMRGAQEQLAQASELFQVPPAAALH